MRLNRHCGLSRFMLRHFVAACLLGLYAGWPTAAHGQFNLVLPMQPAENENPVLSHLHRLPRSPLTSTALMRAREALRSGNVTAGLEMLQVLLDESVEYFRIEGLQLNGSLRGEVEQLIAEHLADYERLYGPEATQSLERALVNQDLDGLLQVRRRFRQTTAGSRAVQLIANWQVSQGEVEMAARSLLPQPQSQPTPEALARGRRALLLLARSGSPELAVAVRDELQAAAGQNALNLPQRDQLPESLFREAGEAALLDWRVPHGSRAHAARSPFAPALFADAWQQPLVDQYDFFLGDLARENDRLEDVQSLIRSVQARIWSLPERVTFPAGRPLIVGKHVIVPGYATTKAYLLDSGELDGVGVNVDQAFEYLHEYTSSPSLMNDTFREEIRGLFFSLRGWRDLTSSSLSSDGKYVYAVSDSQLVGSVDAQLVARTNQRHELLPQSFNQLHAFELQAGMRNRWSIGTVDENAIFPFDLEEPPREIFFYGAPLPVGEQLFVIGEERGQIQLFELDRENGRIVWSIGLLNPDKEIILDEVRRLAGIMPALVNGLLICPTGEGVLTAVDPVSRELVWTHQYGNSRQVVLNRAMFWRGVQRSREQTVRQSIDRLLAEDRWFDVRTISAGRYVVHTPPDSEELICLDVRTGQPVWTEPQSRQRALYAAGIFEQNLILVGRSEIAAIRLEDATRVWSCPIPRPAGRGVRIEDRFLQPLMTGELATIDLQTGRMLSRVPNPERRLLGNLTAAQGRIIAQSGTEVLAFRSEAEIERLLAEVTSEAQKGELTGELALARGNQAAGLADLELVPREQLSPRGLGVLAWAKLDQLQHEFEQRRGELDSIEQLLTTDEQRFHFRRTKAMGLSNAGERLAAFQEYLKLLEALTGSTTLRDVDGLREVNDLRWTLARMVELFRTSEQQEREELSTQLNAWIQTVPDEEAVLQLLLAFPLSAVDQSVALGRLQQLELTRTLAGMLASVLQRFVEAAPATVQTRSFELLTRLALEMNDGSAADHYLQALTRVTRLSTAEQSTAPADPGTTADTADSFANTLRSRPEWQELFNAVPTWPRDVRESEQPSRFAKSTRHQIPIIGPQQGPLAGWSFFLNPMGSHIDVYDEHGRRLCQFSTSIVQPRFPIGSTLGRYASIRGHQALIVLADRFLLVDFQFRKDQPRVLFESLVPHDQNPYGTESVVNPDQRPQPGFRVFRSLTPIETAAGNVGPLGASAICYGYGSQLTALDPLTRKVLWRRHDLASGSEIMADDEYVLTLAPGSRTLRLFDATDGSELGTRPLPEGVLDSNLQRDNGDWGRLLPALVREGEAISFRMFDPVSETAVWQQEFPADTLWCCVNGQDFAFLTPEGKLTILSGQTGEQQLSSVIPRTAGATSLAVLAYLDQWIVVPGKGQPLSFDFSYPSLITRTIEKTAHGTVVAIDRADGQVRWTAQVEDQKIATQVPSAWPILMFGNGSGRNVRGLVLNRWTGESIVEDEWEYDRTWIHWQSSVQPTQILIGYGRKTITLDCVEPLNGEQPKRLNSQPPPPPPQTD